MSDTAANQTHIQIRELLTAATNGKTAVMVDGCPATGDVLAVAVGMLRESQADAASLRAEAERLRAALERLQEDVRHLVECGAMALSDDSIEARYGREGGTFALMRCAWLVGEQETAQRIHGVVGDHSPDACPVCTPAALAGAAADGENKPKVERSLSHFVAEREFLDASVAVWREIDRLSTGEGRYPGIPASTELRKRERAAWERYKLALLRAPADEEGSAA